MPKITIITVVYNNADTIRCCVESVINQTENIEYIIVDGNSNDCTMEILQTYDGISKLISEKDNGIYDALNKGLSLSNGDVIGILHSDDFFPDHNILKKIAQIFRDPLIDSCYGDLQYVDAIKTDKVHRYWKAGEYNRKKFYVGWMPPHPTFFVRRNIYEKYGGFRLDLGTAADYELMLRFLLKFNISSKYLPEVITKMRVGGISNISLKNRIKANINDRRSWTVNNLQPYPWTLFLKPISKILQFI